MQADHAVYDYINSIKRIDEILNNSDSVYEEKNNIPDRNTLTFNNGFYVYCSAIFIDMRKSKELIKNHTKPVVAKIFKSYISELIAVLRYHPKVHEIYIEGDCVWGIFNTPSKSDIDDLFGISAMASSLIDILNIKYVKKGYSKIEVGIGLSYGSCLYIKAGHSGSGINEVVYVGKLVNEAAELCSYGKKDWYDYRTVVSEIFFNNLNDEHKKLLYKNNYRDCYHGDVCDGQMKEWVKSNG